MSEKSDLCYLRKLPLFSLIGFGSQQCKGVTVEETTTSPGDVKQKPRDNIRLPAGFAPSHYNIELRPHIYRHDEIF